MDSDKERFDDRNDDMLGSTWVKDDGSFEIFFLEEQYKENLEQVLIEFIKEERYCYYRIVPPLPPRIPAM